MAVDWTDPCARATALRDAYFALVSGQAMASVRYIGNGVERETTYSRADRDALHRELKSAERECGIETVRAPIRTIRLAPSKGV